MVKRIEIRWNDLYSVSGQNIKETKTTIQNIKNNRIIQDNTEETVQENAVQNTAQNNTGGRT